MTTKVPLTAAEKRAETITALIAEHLGGDPVQMENLDATLVDDLGADSLDSVEIEMALEQEFGLGDDSMADTIKPESRVRDVIAAVEKALAS